MIYTRGQDCVTLDPALAQDEASYQVIYNLFEGLVRLKPGTNEIEPCLAEAWRVSPDGLEWTFYLRKDVRFHDGTPFTSAAVKFSVDRQLPPRGGSGMAYASFAFGMVDKVQTPDPYIVKFLLKYPYAPFLYNLAMPAAAPIVSPSAVTVLGDDFGNRPVGTGPYRFEGWKKGKRTTLKAYEDYWGKVPEHETLVFTVIKNSRLRSLALKLGFADIASEITPDDSSFLLKDGFTVWQVPGQDINYLGFFTDKKPFDNPAVRRAVSMLIDREHIVKSLFPGSFFESNGPLPPGVLGYDPTVRPLPYDPSGANEILAREGLAGGLNITLVTYTGVRPYNPAGGENMARALQAELARAGIETEIKAYPWDQYKEALLKAEGNAFMYGWISDNGDPDNFLYTLLSSTQIESGLNTSRYRNSELDLLLIKAQQEAQPMKREQMYRQAVKITLRDAPWVVLNHSLRLTATSPAVEGFYLHSNGLALLNFVKKTQK